MKKRDFCYLFLILILSSCWSMEDVHNSMNAVPEVTVKKIDTTFIVKDNEDVQYIYTYGKEGIEDTEAVYYAMTISDVNKNLKNVIFLDRNEKPLSGVVYDNAGLLIGNFTDVYEFSQAEQRAEKLQRFFTLQVPCALIAADQKTELPIKVITTDTEGRKIENLFYYKNYKRLDGDIKISITNDTIVTKNKHTYFIDYKNDGLKQLTYKSKSAENQTDFKRNDINFQTFRGTITGKHWDYVDINTAKDNDSYFSDGGSLPNIWVGENSVESYCPIKKRIYPYYFSDSDYKDSPLYTNDEYMKKAFEDVVQTRQGQIMPYLQKENFLAPLEPFTTSPKDNTIPDNWEDVLVGQQALPLKYRIHVDFGIIEQQLLKKYGLENKIRLEFTHELEDAGLLAGQQTLSKRVGIESIVDNNAPTINTFMREKIRVFQHKMGVQYEGLQYIHLLSDEMMINCIGELTERYLVLAKGYRDLGTDPLFFKLYDQSEIRGNNGILNDVFETTTSGVNRLNSNLGIIDRFFTLDGVEAGNNDRAPHFGYPESSAITGLRVPDRYKGLGMDYIRYAHRSFGVEFSDTVLVNKYDAATGVYNYTAQVIRPHINKNLFTFGAGKGYEG